MKILVVGAGSVGVYLGVLLSKQKHNVTLLGREKLRKLHETILMGNEVYPLPRRVYALPKGEDFDFVFITSKLYDLEYNLKKIKENSLSYKFLVSIQNGIVEESIYEKYVDSDKFTSISVYEGFRLLENQLMVNQSLYGWKTDDSVAGKKVSALLQSVGISCLSEKDLDSLKAEKTIMNCCVNVLSAVEKKTFFELCRDVTTRKVIDQLFDESYDVLVKEFSLKPKEELRKLFYEVVGPMKHYSSTYQDAVSGRRTEIEFINGLIVRLGEKYALPTPLNRHLIERFSGMFPGLV